MIWFEHREKKDWKENCGTIPIYVTRVSEEGWECGAENIFEKIMADNVPDLVKDKIQEAQQASNKRSQRNPRSDTS